MNDQIVIDNDIVLPFIVNEKNSIVLNQPINNAIKSCENKFIITSDNVVSSISSNTANVILEEKTAVEFISMPSASFYTPNSITCQVVVESGETCGQWLGEKIYTLYNYEDAGFGFFLTPEPFFGQVITIVDATFTADIHPISINSNGLNMMVYGEFSLSVVINSKGGSLRLVYDGFQWTQLG